MASKLKVIYHGKLMSVSARYLGQTGPSRIRWVNRKIIPFGFDAETVQVENMKFVEAQGRKYALLRIHVGSCWTWCPLCRKKIHFEAWGTVAVDPAKIDVTQLGLEKLRRYAEAIVLAASASILRTHVHCEHARVIHTGEVKVDVKLRKKVGKVLHIFDGMELHKYVCPICGRRVNGIRKFILHIMHKHRHVLE